VRNGVAHAVGVAQHDRGAKVVGSDLRIGVQQREPLCVCDLSAQFSQNQPTISHHLRILWGAALIDTEKRGIWSYYWATDAGRTALSVLGALR
jgi:ArsR family transcriptional regulator